MLTRPAPLTRALIIFLCGVHIVLLTITASSVLGGPSHAEDHLIRLALVGAKSNALIDGGEWWRFASAMFLHAGWIHLAFNVMALHYLGRIVENALGVSGFLLIYFGGGLVASAFSYLYSANLSVGASGSIFALLGASAAYGLYNRTRIPDRLKRFLVVSPLVWIGLNVILSLSIPKIDVAAHAGGLFVGVLLTPFLGDRILLRRSSIPNVVRKGLMFVVMCCIVASLGFWGPRLFGVGVHVPAQVDVVEIDGVERAVPKGWEHIIDLEQPDFKRFAAKTGYGGEWRSTVQVYQDDLRATYLLIFPKSYLGGEADRILNGMYEWNPQNSPLKRIEGSKGATIFEYQFQESAETGPKYRRMLSLGAKGWVYDLWIYEKLFEYYVPLMESLHRWPKAQESGF
jgi:membrane associated rhomboid family serine protease